MGSETGVAPDVLLALYIWVSCPLLAQDMGAEYIRIDTMASLSLVCFVLSHALVSLF